MNSSFIQRLVAEILGTAFLAVAVIGAGIAATSLTGDKSLILFINAIMTALTLTVIISIFGTISGGHFNPAVSFVFALKGELPTSELIGYILAQVIGGYLGLLVTHVMFELPLLSMSLHARSGLSLWLAEGIGSFGLVLTILCAIRFSKPVAWLAGGYLAAAYFFTSSGAFVNPALTLARAFTDTFAGIHLLDVPAFVGAQCIGAVVALSLASWLLPSLPHHERS